MTNLLTRNSPRELTTPFPSKDEMHEIYEAALRAPDHAWLRPSRFIEVTGAGLDKLSNIFIEFAKNELKDVTPLQMEKYQSAPFRAPMIIILTTQITHHPKVPKIEQMLSTATAAENILLALHANAFRVMFSRRQRRLKNGCRRGSFSKFEPQKSRGENQGLDTAPGCSNSPPLYFNTYA